MLGPNEHLVGEPGSRHLIGTPALVLDLDRLDANIRSMAEHARQHGYALRPPGKIHKCSEIARLQVAAGAVGVCCATLSEAETFVQNGVPGVMLFSTVVTDPKLDRLAALNARADGFIVAADSHENVEQLGVAARRSGRPLGVLVDYEVGGGRTGTADEDTAVALARAIPTRMASSSPECRDTSAATRPSGTTTSAVASRGRVSSRSPGCSTGSVQSGLPASVVTGVGRGATRSTPSSGC